MIMVMNAILAFSQSTLYGGGRLGCDRQYVDVEGNNDSAGDHNYRSRFLALGVLRFIFSVGIIS